jgi:predicted metal-dependent hydrolase
MSIKCPITGEISHKPNKINKQLTTGMFSPCSQVIKDRAKALYAIGWRFYVVDQNRGWCNKTTKTITIPSWAIQRNHDGYNVYYIAHELAHSDTWDIHGPKFMARFMELCPAELWYHELEYKPRSAKAAGISAPRAQPGE